MKKFLIFLVSIVIVVCFGLTTYYFVRNNEIISIKTKEIYCNSGDVIPLKSLGINIERANISKKTKFDYNAGGEDVTKFIRYDEESASFVVSQENAGDVTLVIGTSNKKYPDFTINVHIGNGSKENPYYIFNELELKRIGVTYRLDSSYRLMNDITVTSDFAPIGYNSITSSWEGFNGIFDGQGYAIKGINFSEIETNSIGLFSVLGKNSVVKNLTIENAEINGSCSTAGILAGEAKGKIEKVIVKNSTLVNTKNASENGSLVGRLNGEMKVSYAENVVVTVEGGNSSVGGLIGCLDESLIQACYTNNVELNVRNGESVVGGLVGEFVIGTEAGSIQQSYSNTNCSYVNYGALVGAVSKNNTFDLEKANMLRYFIGNIAVVYGADKSSSIIDSDLVNNFATDLFKNETYPERSAFYDRDSALYLIRGFASAGEIVSTNEFIYYALDMVTLIPWDTTYVWNVKGNSLPTLRMGAIYPEDPSGEYFRRDLTQTDMEDEEVFVDVFASDIADQNIKLVDDLDLTNDWTPVAVSNSTIDGNNKTIRVNLNKAVGGNLGLFTKLDNVTIKNLNIVVTGINSNATNAGGLAGTITSTSGIASSIENVKITFENNFAASTITNFGGIAGTVTNANISNCSVVNLIMNSQSQVTTAGAVAGEMKANVRVSNVEIIDSTIYATTVVGGVVGSNAGSILNVSGNVNVKYTSTTSEAYVGGVVASNTGSIDSVDLTVNLSIDNVGSTTYIGGVSATNTGTVSNVTLNGSNVSINTNSTNSIYVGGMVAVNKGTIENVVNNIQNVGTYKSAANHIVGGVAYLNEGKISKVVVGSNLYGNNVSGVVAKMNSLQASIDQVVVGKYNKITSALAQNEIKADRYVAGVSVEFKQGTITNVQAASNLIGNSNSARSSLVVLIFPYGATLKNATINSSFSGYGERYRETWTDFNSYSNKAEFGLQNGETGDERFNLYKYDSYHGVMQSVVINNSNSGVSGAKAAMGAAFMFSKDYQDTAESSFIKVVDGFYDASQFQGSFEFVCAESTVLGIKHKATKTLTFAIDGIWKSNSGISLMFLDEIFA